MNTSSLEQLLDAARKLPPEERRVLAEELIRESKAGVAIVNPVEAALDAVEQTRGAMKGLDRDTIIWLAEDEELCGY